MRKKPAEGLGAVPTPHHPPPDLLPQQMEGCLPTQNFPRMGCVSWAWPGSFQSESGRDCILMVVPLLLPGAPLCGSLSRATGGTGGSQMRGEPGPPLLQTREAL